MGRDRLKEAEEEALRYLLYFHKVIQAGDEDIKLKTEKKKCSAVKHFHIFQFQKSFKCGTSWHRYVPVVKERKRRCDMFSVKWRHSPVQVIFMYQISIEAAVK